MNHHSQDWDPTIAGQTVRLRANPAQQGLTTGKTQVVGTRLLVQIQLGPNQKSFKPYTLLELCDQSEGIHDLLKQGRLSGPDELRRILINEKVKGHLTNIFYSMESSNTDFYPHQFKPVLKFLESPVGRLLIADEVGLGKTIEAIYIWKELHAREGARRLLIVCPALLREKWKETLKQKFNLPAEICNASDLSKKISTFLKRKNQDHFVCIASLEGLRPGPNWMDHTDQGSRSELARLLDDNPANDEWGLFDLAIIDEAHYLRNPYTANHRLGRLIRDASRYLLLLTATPIQIHSHNLYQLLRLLNPDEFFDLTIFESMMEANAPIICSLRAIWSTPPNLVQAKQQLDLAQQFVYFQQNPIINLIQQELANPTQLSEADSIRLGYKLENLSLVGQYICRSRKRDVIPNRVQRVPQTLTVHFSKLERQLYRQITTQIRQQAQDQQGIYLFRLMARQRQMASCLPAALRAWFSKDLFTNVIEDLDQELLWEDFGLDSESDLEDSQPPKQSTLPGTLQLGPIGPIDLEAVEKSDTKYNELLGFLKGQFAKSHTEKFVLFAYFRGTLHYLQRRLAEDHISTYLILGSMREAKTEVLEAFRQDEKGCVLLSSEVGSEGIDLQFCHFSINYDLPWNPMRVEQRIGRLDRLGQKADKIFIINFSLVDTVEEKILERLYERINVFRESIGDLEQILGEMTEKLVVDLLEPTLNDREREQRAEETAATLIKQRVEQEKLEQEAINMIAFSDHILNAIYQSRDQGRWLQPDELVIFVKDFLSRYFPDSPIEPVPKAHYVYQLTLSEPAKVDLHDYLIRSQCPTTTQLVRLPAVCFFDPRQAGSLGWIKGKPNELIDPTHPLIRWISATYDRDQQKFHPASAIELAGEDIHLDPGLYTYSVQHWIFSGLRVESRLVFRLIRCNDLYLFSETQSELIMQEAARLGHFRSNLIHLAKSGDWDQMLTAYDHLHTDLEKTFAQTFALFDQENFIRCQIQRQSAEAYSQRRRVELEERIQRFHQQQRLQMIPATEGLLRKLNRELALKQQAMSRKEETSSDQIELAVGVLWVH